MIRFCPSFSGLAPRTRCGKIPSELGRLFLCARNDGNVMAINKLGKTATNSESYTQLSDREIENSIYYLTQKSNFLKDLKSFVTSLADEISVNGDWTVKGFIDIFKNIYTISCDTKIVSIILELHLFPLLVKFASQNGYRIELASYQNYYPDLTFISKNDSRIKFAVDLKTTYMDDDYPGFCNGFTLGSHGEYFIDRTSTKNIQYPYNQYLGHFCLGIIYSRTPIEVDETHIYTVTELESIPSVAKNFIFSFGFSKIFCDIQEA